MVLITGPVTSCPLRPCKGQTCINWKSCEARKDVRAGGK